MTLKEKLKVEAIVWWIRGLLKPGENARKKLTGLYLGKKLKEAIMANEQQEVKAWWKSRTIIFNVVAGIVALAGTLASDKAIPENVSQIFATIVTIGNVALRFNTSSPVSK